MAELLTSRFRAVVLGVSAGGVAALQRLFAALPAGFALPLVVVHHVSADLPNALASVLGAGAGVRVKEADEGEALAAGTAYLAPPNYHLLVEDDGTLSLSTDAPVSYARPSIDVLFESAAAAFGAALIGVILTGANHDGSAGLRQLKEKGGLAIVQDPDDAEVGAMPRAALACVAADYVLPLARLAPLLVALANGTAPPAQRGE